MQGHAADNNAVDCRRLLATSPVTAVRRRLGGESGFTIIEVLVSALLVALAAVGTFIALDSATVASGRNKARTVASGLAQSDQERLRGLTPLQLAELNQTRTQVVDNQTYTIVSRADWTTDPSGTASCAGMGNEAGYMKITSTVTWPGQAPLNPVEADSLKAMPNGAYRDARGSIAVKLVDRNGAGVSNVPISITGPRSYSATTNSLGCVMLGFVPVGTYTVSFSQAGYVQDVLPGAQALSKQVQVAGEQTSSVSFTYDQAGSLQVKYKTGAPGSATDGDGDGDGFTVAQTGLGYPNIRSFGLLGTRAATQTTGTVLFPFTGAYGVWAGACAEGDPTLYGAPANPLPAPVPAGGALTGVVVRVPTMGLKVTKSDGTAVTGSLSIKPVVTGCTNPVPATGVKTFASSATVQTALPYGDYSVCAQDTTAASAKRRVKTVQNGSINGTTSPPPASNTINLPASNSSSIAPC